MNEETSSRWPALLRRFAPVAILALSLAGLVSQTLAISAMKGQPRYDEVSYMAVARSYQREGGVVGTIRCHLQGRCHEDNRSPLFELLLQTVASDEPGFYATAKIFTLATTLLLLLAGFLSARKLFGPGVAVGSIAVWCLMPSLGELSSRVLADLLFAAVILAAVHAIGACQGAGVLAWLGTGALIGLAYLTKGNGHLLCPALIALGLHRHGLRLLRRPEPYAALLGFVGVTAFLLFRNIRVFHAPFHNYNERLLWLDNWEESWAYLRDPEMSARLGLRFMLGRHSIPELVLRAIKGFGHTVGVTIYAAGLGVTSIKHPEASLDVPTVVARAGTGLIIMVLAGLGLRRRLATHHRFHALAVIYTLIFFVLAFAIGQQGAGEIGVRYVLPLVVLLCPYALYFALEEVWPGLAARWPARASTTVVVLLLGILAAKLTWFGPSSLRDPRTLVAVPSGWAQTSRWFADHLRPGERFAFPYTSLYSTFDLPFPEPDQRWIYLYRLDPAVMHRDLDRGVRASIDDSLVGPPGPIDKIFVDTADTLFRSYEDKLSAARDSQGPLAFLGWPRCFADGDRASPSRFLVFCRP